MAPSISHFANATTTSCRAARSRRGSGSRRGPRFRHRDGNGRAIPFFTRSVNKLSPAGSGEVVLGFYYGRDLLPKQGPLGSCPGSNEAEMFYLLVPDPNGVNGNIRKKSDVAATTNSVVA